MKVLDTIYFIEKESEIMTKYKDLFSDQQIKLRMGIVELKKCYIALKELEFSNDVLDDIADMLDDLESLKESN